MLHRRTVARVQGAYYVASGLWPILSLGTFERITGPKRDDWLVRTVGALAAVIGGVLLIRSAGSSDRPDPLLGGATAGAFAAVDTWYVARGRISPIYLGDAVVELAIIAGWTLAAGGLRVGRRR